MVISVKPICNKKRKAEHEQIITQYDLELHRVQVLSFQTSLIINQTLCRKFKFRGKVIENILSNKYFLYFV